MKVRTKWDREVWCRDSVWESSTDEQEILIWGSELEYALGSNVNEYITKGDLEFIEFDSDYTPAADNEPDLYDTDDVTLDNEKVTQVAEVIETPVISTEDRKEFVVGDLVDVTVPGTVSRAEYPETLLIAIYDEDKRHSISLWVDRNRVRKHLVLTPGAVYRIEGHSFILTTDNIFLGIMPHNVGIKYTIEEARKLNITKE